jgi:hypothetical protein
MGPERASWSAVLGEIGRISAPPKTAEMAGHLEGRGVHHGDVVLVGYGKIVGAISFNAGIFKKSWAIKTKTFK